MIDLKNCFPNQVGITTRDCDCFPNSAESGFNITESTSGLYLDKFVDLRDAAFERCGESDSVLTRMNKALEQSFKDVTLDIADYLEGQLGFKSKGHFKGEIGTKAFRSDLSKPQTYRGVKILPKNRQGGIVRVTGVDILLSDTSTFDLTFVDGNTGETVTREVTSTANEWKTTNFSEAYEFSMEDLSGEEDHGFIVYHTQTGTKNHKIDCGCGRKPKWTSFLDARGVLSNSNDVDDLFASSSEYSYGVRLHVQVTCQLEAEICQFEGTRDRALAEARVLITAINILKEMITTREVTKFTVYEDKSALEQIEGYQQEYYRRISYLAKNAQGSDCYYCNPSVTKKKILS